MANKHGWNTWEQYCQIHDRYIEHFKQRGFVLDDKVVPTITAKAAFWQGEVYCRDGIEIHVRKRQEVRRQKGRQQVRTVEYSYQVLLRMSKDAVKDIVRYDNAHTHVQHNDPHHKHKFTATGKEIITHVGMDYWPTFSQVIGEVEQWWEANLKTEP